MAKVFVFEGVDGVGKTTLLPKIQRALEEKEYTVEVLSDPSKEFDTTRAIRNEVFTHEYPPEQASILFKAARVVLENRIAASSANIVLVDRYWPSTAVYQYKGLADKKYKEVLDLMLEAIPANYFLLYLWSDVILTRINQRSEQINHYDALTLEEIQDRMIAYEQVFQMYDSLKTGNTYRKVLNGENALAVIVPAIVKDMENK